MTVSLPEPAFRQPVYSGMQYAPDTDEITEFDAETSEVELMEGDIHEMVRRLAGALDSVVNPAADSRFVVAEALMRLASGVYSFAAGPEATRERLMMMALRTSAGATIN